MWNDWQIFPQDGHSGNEQAVDSRCSMRQYLLKYRVTVAQACRANCGDRKYKRNEHSAKWFVDGIGLLRLIKCNVPDLAGSPELSGARALRGAWRMHSPEGKGRPWFLLHRDSGRCELFPVHASNFGIRNYSWNKLHFLWAYKKTPFVFIAVSMPNGGRNISWGIKNEISFN